MKKIRIIFLLSVFVLAAQAIVQTDIQIRINDKQTDSLVLDIMDKTFRKVDRQVRIAAKEGKANYRMEEKTVRVVRLSTPAKDPDQTFNFFAVPGKKITISGTWEKPLCKGHQLLFDDQVMDDQLNPIYDKITEILKQVQNMQAAGDDPDSIRSYYFAKLKPLQKKIQDIKNNFITEHPDHDFSAYLAFSGSLNPEIALGKLDPKVRNGIMKEFIEGNLEARRILREEEERKAKEREAKIEAMNGKPAPDFTLNDMDDKPLSLSSLRGKYVIIDFWGSWCYWCMKGVPDMKKYYDQYSDRMEILGVDCNDSPEKWRNTVKEHKMNWKHVYNPKTNREVLQNYAVSGFPTKVIVSPEGKIIKTVSGESPDFYEFLDKLFK